MGRVVVEKKVFDGSGEFDALRSAEAWLERAGYSLGSGCAISKKRAIKKGDWIIAKWRDLTPSEREDIDGLMTAEGGNFRIGPVIVEIYA